MCATTAAAAGSLPNAAQRASLAPCHGRAGPRAPEASGLPRAFDSDAFLPTEHARDAVVLLPAPRRRPRRCLVQEFFTTSPT